MWPSDSGQSWRNARRALTVAFSKGRFYFYGDTVNNSLWTGRSWATPEEAANAAEQAYEMVNGEAPKRRKAVRK